MSINKKASTTGNSKGSNSKSSESRQGNNSPLTVYDAIDAFKQVLLDHGAVIDTIKTDAGIQRVHHETDKGNSRSFWYNFHTDGDIPAGAFGNWRTGLSDTFYYKKDNKPLTDSERAELTRIYTENKKKRQKEQLAKYAKARRMSNSVWSKAQPAKSNHPYLLKKHCEGASQYLRMDSKANLLVPIYNQKRLVSLQYVNQKGGKFFVKGSELKGSYFMFGSLKNPFNKIMICEGISTGWTVHTLADQAPTFCAMNAGNLKAVALSVRKAFPDTKKIIVCCDNDIKKDNSINIGVLKGIEASKACNGFYSIPQFPDPSQGGDWNDLLILTQQKARANHE